MRQTLTDEKTTEKMNNNTILTIMAATLMTLAACTSDDTAEQGSALPEGEYPLRIASVTVSEKPQTRVSEDYGDSSKSIFEWDGTEKIGVSFYGEIYTYTLNDDYTLTADKTPYWKSTAAQTVTAWYPATDGTVSLADQSGGLAYVMKATAENATYDSDIYLTFSHQLAKVRVKLSGTAAGDVTAVAVKGYTSCATEQGSVSIPDEAEQGYIKTAKNAYEFYYTKNPGTEEYEDVGEETCYEACLAPQTISATDFVQLTIDGKTYTCAVSNAIKLEAGKSYTFEIDGIDAQQLYYLKGKFMVGTDKYVQFTRGNLQYDITTSKFQLASEQWKYLNEGTGYTVENDYLTAPTVIDLFGWGTGTNPTYASSSRSNYSTYNEWGTSAKNDISNLGDARTLTKDEWTALFTNQYFATVKLSGDDVSGTVLGMVVFPYGTTEDEAKGYISNGSGTVYKYIGSYLSFSRQQTMTVSDLVKSGALFLPAGGNRPATDANYAGEDGYYWTSTVGMAGVYAYAVKFSDGILEKKDNYCLLYVGLSVRLAKDTE